jgi:hypothetical protein
LEVQARLYGCGITVDELDVVPHCG